MEVRSEAEQATWLKEALGNVKRSAYYLRKAVDDEDVKDALRYSAAMLGELRTSALEPQKYYELCMSATDQLRFLEDFFREQRAKGRSSSELYELVQHAGNVLPRLYLLCMVGAQAVSTGDLPARLVLRDVSEACKGVQHATRGLFLRAFLVQSFRGVLLRDPSEGGSGGGDEAASSERAETLSSATSFLLSNFAEMNKLWVRLKLQGSRQDQARRDSQRRQLSDLVGKNLTYLSQLPGLTFEIYQNEILPRALEQVVACRDELAQQYLMTALVLAFPDDFHLGTLSTLLGALPELQPGVRVALVLSSLLDRLAAYVAATPGARSSLDTSGAFGELVGVARKVLEQHPDLSAADVAGTHTALLGFARAVYPEQPSYSDAALEACAESLAGRAAAIHEPRVERALLALLAAPLTPVPGAGPVAADSSPVEPAAGAAGDSASAPHAGPAGATGPAATVLSLPHYGAVLALLSPRAQREAALALARAVRPSSTLATAEQTRELFGLLSPLFLDDPEAGTDDEDAVDDSDLLARSFAIVRGATPAERLGSLRALRALVLPSAPTRRGILLPPLAFAALAGLRAAVGAGAGADPADPPVRAWVSFAFALAQDLADVPSAALATRQLLSVAVALRRGWHEEAEAEDAAVVRDAPSGDCSDSDAEGEGEADAGATSPAAPATPDGLQAARLAALPRPDLVLSLYEGALDLLEAGLPDQDARARALRAATAALARDRALAPGERAALADRLVAAGAALGDPTERVLAAIDSFNLFWQVDDDKLGNSREGGRDEGAAAGPDGDSPGSAAKGAPAHLSPLARDGEGAARALARAGRLATAAKRRARTSRVAAATPVSARLFSEVAGGYLLAVEAGVGGLTAESVISALRLAAKESRRRAVRDDPSVAALFASTLAHARAQAGKPSAIGSLLAPADLDGI